jgi:anti-sigma factor RsiW
MKCHDVRRLLNPYTDDELDTTWLVQVEEHLSGCADCAQQEKNLRSLRSAISCLESSTAPMSPLHYSAPPGLRERIEVRAVPATHAPLRSLRWPIAIAASVLLLIGAGAIIGMLLLRPLSIEDRLAEAVVAGHVRSLQVGHLMDVASTDRHTVKPWFQSQARLDFSPEVPDLSDHGFALTGGRLDYLTDRPVAALVFQRRSHVINLFTWPAGGDAETEAGVFTRHGYHIRRWQRGGMVYWAISDLNDQELDDFVALLRHQETAGSNG